jgi:hypothetical protein
MAPSGNVPAGPGGLPAGAPMPRRSYPRRRSPALVSLGVVLVVIGALAGWQFVQSATSADRQVIAVYQDVPQGEQITADDLQVVGIVPVHGLLPIAASRMSSVVGQYAKVTLVPGTLLTDADLSTSNVVGPDDAVIGLELTANQRPQRTLRPGDHVMLVPIPAANGGGAADQADVPVMSILPATVVDVGHPDNQNTAVVDVLVPKGDATAVAGLANLSRVAVILVAGS